MLQLAVVDQPFMIYTLAGVLSRKCNKIHAISMYTTIIIHEHCLHELSKY